MTSRQKVVVAVVAVLLAGTIGFFTIGRGKKTMQQIDLNNNPQAVVDEKPLNSGDISAIAGLPCENRNRRPVAVMQPADVSARPAAGFSDADMVVEMPVITAIITRLMAVYQCNTPDDVGSMRSSRHDFIHLAKGLDAIYVSWGGSHFAKEKLDEGVIDNMNCNNDGGKSAAQYCYRKQATGTMHGVDTGYAKFEKLLEGAKDFGYRMENKFSGYPHREEAPIDQRPTGGHVRIGYPGPYEAEYFYDKETNTWKRTWGNVAATDRNNGNRIAPKNIAVIFSKSEQIEGQYNNMQLGDPWYDQSDSGDAYYFMDGRQIRGTWKKDKSNIASKLTFYDESGAEVKFIPGQIWVNVVEPGTAFKWEPGT
ncbi:MAG: DUF3048 domain-containing protein [Candidatus Moraniibacteriota bacterium]